MDNYREKIVRIVERELKRTEEYQQRRDEYGNEEYILGCIMVKGDAFPKEVIAHAFVEDMGLELQFQIWRDEPRIRQKQAMWYDLTLFDVEGDFFGKLEQGYLILSVSDLSIAPLGMQRNIWLMSRIEIRKIPAGRECKGI